MFGHCFPTSDIDAMLTRMYNLAMYANLPVLKVPWSWVMFWSRTLEAELSQARLQQLVAKNKPKRFANR